MNVIGLITNIPFSHFHNKPSTWTGWGGL